MGLEDSHILVETGDELVRPKTFIYIQPTIASDGSVDYEMLSDASVGDVLNSIHLLWQALKNEAEEMSEQDLYEICEDFDLDYDTFKKQMRGE